MSKLCVKCGAALEDTAMFCNICGAQQSAPQQPVYQQPAPQQPVYQQPAPQQPKKELKLDKKKIITIGGIAAAVILVVVLLFVLIPPAGSGAVDACYDIKYQGETADFEDALPESIWEYYEDAYEQSMSDYEKYAEKGYKENHKTWKKQYGSDYKVTYKIIDSETLDDSDVGKLASKLAKNYKFDGKKYLEKDDVEAIKEIWVQVTFEGEKDTSISVHHRALIKIDGKWYLGYIEKDNGKYEEVDFYI